MKVHVLLAVALVAVTLAGCSSPPAGALKTTSGLRGVEGNVLTEYHPAENPLNTTTQGALGQCLMPPAPAQYQCKAASSRIRVHLDAAPDPGASGYHAILVSPTGAEKDLGALILNGTASYEVTYTEDADIAAEANTVDIRLGHFVLAQSSAKQPVNPIVVPDQDLRVEVEAAYKGTDLTIKVAGLPTNGTYTGRLYAEENGVLVPKEEFPIPGNGETTFRAMKNIPDYKQFHIHVTGSGVTLIMMEP